MKLSSAFIFAATLALSLLGHQVADAQQSSGQQKCINALNKDFVKLAGSQGKAVCRCIKDRTKGAAVLIEDCMGVDPIDTKVERAKAKIVQDFAAKCSGAAAPSFGPNDVVAIGDAAVAKELDLVHDIFGNDLDAAIPQLSSTNRDQLRCQQAIVKAAKKCQSTKLKEFLKCKKAGLAGKTPPGDIVAPGQIETVCMMQSADPTTGQPDPRGKIAKACDPTVGKILSTVERKCAGVPLSTAFPGCATDVSGELTTCVDQHVECRVCLALNAVDNLNRDCDLFDDGTTNLSCGTPADKCGPGAHWIDTPCAAGLDLIEKSKAKFGIDLDLDCIADTSTYLFGDALIQRSESRDVSANFPGPADCNGSPCGVVDGHLDVIDTEIETMSLVRGPIALNAGAAADPLTPPSRGTVVENAGDPTLADSFFDIFFEVVSSGNKMYNHVPFRVQSPIDCVPPDTKYIHPTDCLPLYDDPIAGTVVANLVVAEHDTNFCGNNFTGNQEECDGTDDAACPGQCQVDCTCATPGKCGPSDHWIDSPLCAGGPDTITDSRAQIGIDTDGDCFADVSTVLFGDALIQRSGAIDSSSHFSGATDCNGSPCGTVDAHLDVIDTELVQMSLVSGPITVNAGTSATVAISPSLGTIVEQLANPAVADSFFDVFFEILVSGAKYYNQSPFRLESEISCVPPETTYVHPTGCLPLFDQPIGGTQVANLVLAQHNTNTCGNNRKGEDEECDGSDDTACPGACQLDCTCPPCAGGMCGDFPSCNQILPSCGCQVTAEGGAICADPFACASAADCPGGSADCPAGQTCYVDTCCGVPKCGEASCAGVAPQSGGNTAGVGPTSTRK